MMNACVDFDFSAEGADCQIVEADIDESILDAFKARYPSPEQQGAAFSAAVAHLAGMNDAELAQWAADMEAEVVQAA